MLDQQSAFSVSIIVYSAWRSIYVNYMSCVYYEKIAVVFAVHR